MLKLNQHLVTCPTTLIEYYLVKYFDLIVESARPQLKQVVVQRRAIAQYCDRLIYVVFEEVTDFAAGGGGFDSGVGASDCVAEVQAVHADVVRRARGEGE